MNHQIKLRLSYSKTIFNYLKMTYTPKSGLNSLVFVLVQRSDLGTVKINQSRSPSKKKWKRLKMKRREKHPHFINKQIEASPPLKLQF